jgi:D-glycero-D-manno-heptose 1,7-bisphosphate phosphatase
MSTGFNSSNLYKLEHNLKTIFLDRDGVINRKMPEGKYVSRWDQFEILPGVPDAIAALNRRGLRVVVVSNQRGIALGLYTRADVDSIHNGLQQQLAESGGRVDSFYVCPHGKDGCNCRKPRPGLFEQACTDFPDIEPSEALMIGDSLSDIEFGKNLGLKTIFITGNMEHPKGGVYAASMIADFTFPTLFKAISCIFGTP